MRGQFDPKPAVVTDRVEGEHPPFLTQAQVGVVVLGLAAESGAANVSHVVVLVIVVFDAEPSIGNLQMAALPRR